MHHVSTAARALDVFVGGSVFSAVRRGLPSAAAGRAYPVRGKITLDGQPLPRGSVTLRPETPQAGHQPTGMIEPAGEYVVYTNRRAGAPPGSYKVVVFATEA